MRNFRVVLSETKINEGNLFRSGGEHYFAEVQKLPVVGTRVRTAVIPLDGPDQSHGVFEFRSLVDIRNGIDAQRAGYTHRAEAYFLGLESEVPECELYPLWRLKTKL